MISGCRGGEGRGGMGGDVIQGRMILLGGGVATQLLIPTASTGLILAIWVMLSITVH